MKWIIQTESTRKQLIWMTLIAVLVLGSSLGLRDLWSPDEPRYAEIAREMLEKNSFFLPYLNYEVYYNKPPGFFWLIMLASLPVGHVTATTARIPSVVFGSATIFILLLWTRRYLKNISPFAPPLILLSSYLFWWFGGRANIDISFAFFIVSASLLFHHGYHSGKGKFTHFYSLAYLSIGIALIIKGPFALLPLVSIIVYLIVLKDKRAISGLRIPSGFILILVPVMVWIIPATMASGWSYIQGAVFHQIGGRLASSYSHPHPFYFYLYMLPLNYLPWAFLLIVTVFYLIRRKIQMNDALLYSIICAATIFVVISAVSAKQSHYLLPLFPATAVIIAHFLVLPEKSGVRFAAYLTVAILFIAFAALPFVVFKKLPEFLIPSIVPACIAVIGFSLSFYAIIKKTSLHFFFSCLTGTILCLFFVSNIYLIPKLNPIKSLKYLVQPYNDAGSKDAFGVYCRPHDWSFNFPFFIHRPVSKLLNPADVEKFIDTPGKKYLAIRKKYFEKFNAELRSRFSIIVDRQVGDKSTLLLIAK